MEIFQIGLRRARLLAQQHMRTRLDHGHMWDERTVTQLLLAEAHDVGGIRYAEFTQRQEADLGADWIWWFIDRSGECFGMLTQAKSLKRSNAASYHIDFGYRDSHQIISLRDTADRLSIPAAYILYCGDTAYRSNLACHGDCTTSRNCDECDRKSVAILPALMAHHTLEWGHHSSEIAFQFAMPLERIGNKEAEANLRYRPGWGLVNQALKTFLNEPQVGAQAIAKSIFLQVQAMRLGQMSALSTGSIDAGSDAIFTDYPSDRGHFPIPYTPYVLRGLRSKVPGYVAEFIQAGTVSRDLTEQLDGIAVIFV